MQRWLKVSVVVGLVVALATAGLRFVVSPPLGPLTPVDLNGTTAIITGASAGVGKETARVLMAWGADVILACRNFSKGYEVLMDIRRTTGKTSGEVWTLDLASFSSVQQFALKFFNTNRKLQLLINNAGMARISHKVTEDGIDEMYQVNHLSHFLLTNLLMIRLKESAPSRIVHLSSEAHMWGNISAKWDTETKGIGPEVGGVLSDYGTTKLMNVLFGFELARRLQGTGVTSNVVHPGFVVSDLGFQEDATDFGSRIAQYMTKTVLAPLLARDQVEGAKTSLYVATSPELEGVSGAYFDGYAKKQLAPAALNATLAAELWKTSAVLTGLGQ